MSDRARPTQEETISLHEAWKISLQASENWPATQYLTARGVTTYMSDMVGLRFSTILKRILFRHNDYIQGRAIVDYIQPKYINTTGDKPIYRLCNQAGAFKPLVLVEGIYDALALWPSCSDIVVTFGSYISGEATRNINCIMDARGSLPGSGKNLPLVIWFDADARKAALRLASDLTYNAVCRFTENDEDPSALGVAGSKDKLWEWFQQERLYWSLPKTVT